MGATGRWCATATALALLAAGCANAPPARPTHASTAMQLAAALRSQEAGTSLVGVLQDLGEPPAGQAYLEGTFRWCAKGRDPPNALEGVQARFNELCAAKFARTEGRVCVQPGATERVLYFAEVRVERACEANGSAVVTQVIQPRGDPLASGYLRRLALAGYPSPQEAQARAARQTAHQRAQTDAAQRQAAINLAQVEADLPRMRKRGATVCRTERSVMYRGFVEDFTDEKLKINVVFGAMANAPSLAAPGFTPVTIWDSPGNWRLCE